MKSVLGLLLLCGCATQQGGASQWPPAALASGVDANEAAIDSSPANEEPHVRRAAPRQPLLETPPPEHLGSVRIDLQRLPLAPPEQAARGESVALNVDLSDVSIAVASGLVVEVQLGDVSVFSQSTSPMIHGPANGSQRPLKTRCSELGDGDARWRGFVAAEVTAETMPFVEFAGRYEAKRCRAVATRRRAVTATAIVPGAIYAFRVCDHYCEANALAPAEERVIVIAPPSPFFLESAANARDLSRPHVGSFSIGEIPIKVGSANSLSLSLPVSAFDASGLAEVERMVGAERVKVDLEASRPSAQRPAEMRLHLAVVKAETKLETTVEARSAGTELAPTVVRRLRRPGSD